MSIDSRKGKLLIAAPSMLDPNFARTVTLMIDDNDDGSIGLVLNRAMQLTVVEAWDRLERIETPCRYRGKLYQGGPCPGPMAVLHKRANLSMIEVTEGVYFTTDSDHIAELLEQNEPPMRCFVNYAGWGPGQLEMELDFGSWVVMPSSHATIFESQPDPWDRLLQAVAPIQATQLRNPDLAPPDPDLN